jgi:hypothetical protein
MDWHQDFTIIDSTLYARDRWLGSLSSHSAAMAGLRLMRTGERGAALTDSDVEILEAIDMDEV